MNTRTISCIRHFLPCPLLNRLWNDPLQDYYIARRISDFSSLIVVQEITKKVKQYGKLFIDVPWNVQVKPTDPHDYPDMDTIIVKLLLSKNDYSKESLSVLIKDEMCKVTSSKVEKLDRPSDAICLIETPIQYDVDARTVGDFGIKISGMVSDLINVRTEEGDIGAEKLQAKKIKLNSSQGGSIYLRKSLQGDIEIKTTKNGSIKAEKCLGTSLEMTTENGDVSLGSNYCEKATFATTNGNLSLNNLHMDATVDISGKGSLNVSCLDGSLQAKLQDGVIKVQLVRLTGKSQIISESPIHLIVPRENNVQLNLKGSKLSIDEDLYEKGLHSDDKDTFKTNGTIPLYVETSDTIRVTSASWADSLQLGNFVK